MQILEPGCREISATLLENGGERGTVLEACVTANKLKSIMHLLSSSEMLPYYRLFDFHFTQNGMFELRVGLKCNMQGSLIECKLDV